MIPPGITPVVLIHWAIILLWVGLPLVILIHVSNRVGDRVLKHLLRLHERLEATREELRREIALTNHLSDMEVRIARLESQLQERRMAG